jgi:uracil-DNA glycosylase family 4
LSDQLRQYLEQQIELGGAEIVVEKRMAPIPAKTPPIYSIPSSDSQPLMATSAADSIVSSRTASASEPAIPRWRKDAPPIPGPGLRIEPPMMQLGDPFAEMETLEQIAAAVACCTRCPLHRTRTNGVPGEGDPAAGLLLVGEGPGETEDRLGRPFVGRAGELLDKLLAAIDLPRQSVYIANIVKSRPPQNRKPLPDEVSACIPYLHRQIAIIKPKVILALGGTAGESLLGVRKSLTELRGKVHRYGGIPLMVTYHPAALLRNPNWKKPTWDDVRIVRQLLDR